MNEANERFDESVEIMVKSWENKKKMELYRKILVI